MQGNWDKRVSFRISAWGSACAGNRGSLQEAPNPINWKIYYVYYTFLSSVVKNWKLWAKFTADAFPLSSVTLEMGWPQLTAPLKCHRLPLDCMFGAKMQKRVRRQGKGSCRPHQWLQESLMRLHLLPRTKKLTQRQHPFPTAETQLAMI